MDNKETLEEQLARVQAAYQTRASAPTRSMSAEQKKDHAEACRKLLAEKLRLRAVISEKQRLK
jgi:hypothetical protein